MFILFARFSWINLQVNRVWKTNQLVNLIFVVEKFDLFNKQQNMKKHCWHVLTKKNRKQKNAVFTLGKNAQVSIASYIPKDAFISFRMGWCHPPLKCIFICPFTIFSNKMSEKQLGKVRKGRVPIQKFFVVQTFP